MKLFWTIKAIALYMTLTWPYSHYNEWWPVRDMNKGRPPCVLVWYDESGHDAERHPIYCWPHEKAMEFKLWLGNGAIPHRAGFR